MGTKVGVLLAVAFASLMLGCGSSGDDSSEPLTKQAFVKQGNAICEEGLKEKDRILKAAYAEAEGEEPGKEQLEELVLEVLPPIEETTEQLGELTPPAKDEKTVSTFVEGYERDLQEAEEEPKKALEEGFLQDPNQAAQEYGLTSCNL